MSVVSHPRLCWFTGLPRHVVGGGRTVTSGPRRNRTDGERNGAPDVCAESGRLDGDLWCVGAAGLLCAGVTGNEKQRGRGQISHRTLHRGLPMIEVEKHLAPRRALNEGSEL